MNLSTICCWYFFILIQVNCYNDTLNCYISVITSLKESYLSSWVFFFYTESTTAEEKMVLWHIQKYFSKDLKIPTTSAKLPQLHSQGGIPLSGNASPLYILLKPDNITKVEFNQTVGVVTNTLPVWVLFVDPEFSFTWFDDINIPFNVRMLVVKFFENNTVIINEVFNYANYLPLNINAWGSWSKDGGLNAPVIPYYWRRRNLTGVKFKAAVAHHPPGTQIAFGQFGDVVRVNGFIGRLWNHMEMFMHFTTSYIVPPDNSLGSMDENGVFSNGMLGLLAKNEVELALGALSITKQRETIADFSNPPLQSVTYLFIRQPESTELNWMAFTQPFHWDTWLGTIIVAGILPSLGGALCRFAVAKGHYAVPNKKTPPRGYFDAMHFSFAALCQQGVLCFDGPWAHRVIMIFSYVTAVVLYTAYCSSLISSLAVKPLLLPFNTLAEFVRDGSYKCGVMGNSSEQDMFSKNAITSQTDRITMRLTSLMDSSENFPSSNALGLEYACTRKRYAYLMTTVRGKGWAYTNTLPEGCELYRIPTYVTGPIAFAARNNWPYMKVFDNEINILRENGLLKHSILQSWPLRPPKETQRWVPVFFGDIIPYLCMLSLGFIAGSIFLILEWAWYSTRQPPVELVNIKAIGDWSPPVKFIDKTQRFLPKIDKNELYY